MANTQAEWREGGYLRFKDAFMFKSVASASTNVRLTAEDSTTPTLVVSCPIYAGTFTTQRNITFRAKVAGIAASATAQMEATLRYGTSTILAVTIPTSAHLFAATTVPYSFEFTGRIANYSTLGNITATCVSMMGGATGYTRVQATTGSTNDTGVKMSTSKINLKRGTTLGLNILINVESTNGGAGGAQISAFTNTVAYIELFSG